MSALGVPRDFYLHMFTRGVAQMIDRGLDLRAAREQTAFEMRDWYIIEDRIATDNAKDAYDLAQGDWTR